MKVVLVDRVGRDRRVVVVMADITQEDRAGSGARETAALLQRGRIPRRPPRVEMAAVTAAQPRTSPASIHALRGLVVQAARIHGETLQQEGSPPADAVAAVVGE